jgi:hypothetical protein
MLKFQKFIPLSKVEEQADGSLFVYGLVTAEKPDQEKEVCDYDSTKPLYQKLNEKYLKATSAVEGMEKSIAPLREMHQLKAVGCGKSIEFNDAEKEIHMGFKVVDRDACTKVRAGVLVGFSQGGDYVKTWQKNGFTWYTADPGEVSLVDSPCLEEAMISSISQKTFSYVKTDGSLELRKFVTEKPAGDDAKKLADLLKKSEELVELEKSGREKLQKQLDELTKEISALQAAKSGTGEKTMNPEELKKAMASAHSHLVAMHKAHTDHCAAMHKAHTDHMNAMHECIGKCAKALGVPETGAGEVHDGNLKAKEAEELRKKAEADAAAAAAAGAMTPEKIAELVKAGVDAAVAKIAEDQKEKDFKKTDPARQVRLQLVGRDGKVIENDAQVTAREGEEMSKSAGI